MDRVGGFESRVVGSKTSGFSKYGTCNRQDNDTFKPMSEFFFERRILIAKRFDKTFHYGKIRNINVSIRSTFQQCFQPGYEHLVFFDEINCDTRIEEDLWLYQSHELRVSSI